MKQMKKWKNLLLSLMKMIKEAYYKLIASRVKVEGENNEEA